MGLGHKGGKNPSRLYYDLVWHGMVLFDDRKFEDYVQDHGMSVDEPVDVLVVYRERHSESVY